MSEQIRQVLSFMPAVPDIATFRTVSCNCSGWQFAAAHEVDQSLAWRLHAY